MVKAWERLVNLAIALASTREGITAEQVRGLSGYSEGSAEAFNRMFERDKKDLREAGFVIETLDDNKRYRLDAAATFAGKIELTPEETAALRVVGVAMLEDPSFPHPVELRLALAKIATALDRGDARAVARYADEAPAEQARSVADLDQAIAARKSVTFGYTNSRGEAKTHSVEPYGAFAHEGRWYLVARDTALDEIRVYAVVRMSGLRVNDKSPETPDFERPDDFDVRSYMGLRFQYGREPERTAALDFAPSAAWRLDTLSRGRGDVTRSDDGSARWSITYRDERALLGWIVENGPGIASADPALAARLDELLAGVARMHSEGEVA